ncbi:MAG TPA: twin-arginine translocase TatA/TatE family subunit [Anaerolineaceae bacterium]|jgi:sec-independent protein translocase protein TatA
MPFGFQPIHLVVVFIVALVIFGPQRLPEIGRGVGKAIVEFRKGAREMTDSFREEVNVTAGSSSSLAAAPPHPAASGNYCMRCGAPNPADARFCNRCGSPFPGTESANATLSDPRAESAPTES